MEKLQNYNYSEIEEHANQNDMEIIEHGKFMIGEHILTLKDPSEMVITLVLTGYNSKHAIYECVYTDF